MKDANSIFYKKAFINFKCNEKISLYQALRSKEEIYLIFFNTINSPQKLCIL